MPKVFGWQHLTYLAVFIVIAIILTFFILKYAKAEKMLALIMKIIGGLLFICIVWNRTTLVMKYNGAWFLIPDTFCGISSLILSLALLIGKRNNFVFHFICYLGFIGGLIVLVYPDFIGQASSIFYPATISGLYIIQLCFMSLC